MSQTILEKLLNGAEVEWKTLGEVCKFKNGFAFKSSLFKEVGDPIVRITNIDGKIVNTDDVKYFHMKDYIEDLTSYTVNKGDIIIAMSGATTGKIGLYNYEYTSYLNQRVGKFIPKQKILNNKYLYHYLQLKINDIFAIAGGGAQPNLSSNKLMEKFKIPIPPLSVQKEIVRILDAFTAHTAELTAELNERKKQYNYYLNKLLTFSDDEVEWKTLKDISDVQRGASPRPIAKYISDVCSGIPWIKIGDAPLNSKYINRTRQRITPEGATKSRILKKGDLILSNSMSYGRPYILELDGAIHDGWASINKISNKVLVDFLYYYLNSDDVRNYWENRINSGSVSNLNSVIINSLPIPIPSLSVQKEIVRILDSFSTLTTSISEGLPREIELRNKQYEYYRDQLLNFPKPGNDAIKHNSTNR